MPDKDKIAYQVDGETVDANGQPVKSAAKAAASDEDKKDAKK